MSIYCTYITFYRGNLLPPFYIGSTKLVNLNKGYRGSVRSKKYQAIWESELQTNPHLFVTKLLTTHETHGDALEREAKFQKALNAVNNELYINMGIAKRGFGDLSTESRKIISEKAKKRDYSYLKGSNHHYYGGRSDLNQSGGKNPNAKKCMVFNLQFDSISEAALHFNLPYKRCYSLIRNKAEGCCYI